MFLILIFLRVLFEKENLSIFISGDILQKIK